MSDEQPDTQPEPQQQQKEPDWMRRQWGDGINEGTCARVVYVQRAPRPDPGW